MPDPDSDPMDRVICHLAPGEVCKQCGAVGATREQAGNGLNDTWEGDPLSRCAREIAQAEYDHAHHVFFAKEAAKAVPALIESGDLLAAHHELERAMNDLGAAMDFDRTMSDKPTTRGTPYLVQRGQVGRTACSRIPARVQHELEEARLVLRNTIIPPAEN